MALYGVLDASMCFYMGEGKLGLKRLIYDVLNPGGSFKTHVTFEHEQKTGKKSIVLLNSNAENALAMYFNSLNEYRMSDWLFPNSKKPDER